MFLPNKVYVIKTSKDSRLGFRVKNKSYIIGFSTETCAKYVSKTVTHKSKLSLQDKNADVCYGMMTLQKQTQGCDATIEEVSLNYFMSLPTMYNCGVICGLELVENMNDAYMFDSFIADPIYAIE